VARAARDRWEGARLVRHASRALTPPPPWAFHAFGDRSIIVPPARIERPGQISIGAGALLHEHAWLVVRGTASPSLVIGDRSVLNRFVKVVCFGSVTIGPGAIIGDHAYVSDVEYEPGHADVDPEHRPLTEPQPVVLEPGVALGVGVIVKPGVTIGERAYVGAGSIVTRDVPPHCLAVGAPARVVRRFDET
jgi:acetyltransferase-like isoleucine patch superfamily enzyme